MANPDRVALGAMAGTGAEPTSGNGVSKGAASEAARAAAIAEMPDFTDADPAEAGPEPTAPAETKAEPTKPEPTPDPGDAQLGALKKREARQREDLAKEKAAIDAQRAELAERLAKIEKWEALAAKAKLEPDEVIRELAGDLDDETAILAARRFYARTAKAKDDPRAKASVEQLTKEASINAKLSAIEKKYEEKLTALEQKVAAKEKAEAEAQFASEFRGRIEKALTDDAPLVKSRLSKNPTRALEGLAQAAVALMERDETDETPEPADIIAQYQKMLTEELAELGLDATVKPAAKATTAAASTAGKSITADLAAGTKPPDPKRKRTPEEIRADVLRDWPEFPDE